MILLFFNYEEDLNKVSRVIFESLGINESLEGESSNVLGGVYYSFSIFGVKIKLEVNSYDYEDEYAYMLSIGKDLVSSMTVDDKIVDLIGEVVKRLLYIQLSLAVAEDKNNKLEIYTMPHS
ncbi:hypothetical protein ACDQ55_21595 [Chitinophaga sp. 30R24]|uniref:hypothetical protein n=1 Tax=Chitinophaga sp. 30R24 TaxID=3248838 RepID=UPI003B9001D9